MRIAVLVLSGLMSIAVSTSIVAQTIVKAPNAVTCDEYMKLLINDPSLPGFINEDLLKLNAYHGWAVGYIQGKDPSLFPALVKKSGKNITPDEEFGFYTGLVSSIYKSQCQKRGSMKLEELTNIMVERLSATFK